MASVRFTVLSCAVFLLLSCHFGQACWPGLLDQLFPAAEDETRPTKRPKPTKPGAGDSSETGDESTGAGSSPETAEERSSSETGDERSSSETAEERSSSETGDGSPGTGGRPETGNQRPGAGNQRPGRSSRGRGRD
ncbi:translation initiation factor IF-2-like [Branchiostoma floridae]|uniref:Translation initiation factor IF-2-like n=1 Tax=Branchiostoma floridae TaxID=7739 RepID=A0A9J7HVF6_BRAFL|nr:translation initiation factor IF-2-like [Branchiostoma floridae]